eukprot:gene20015-26732_t
MLQESKTAMAVYTKACDSLSADCRSSVVFKAVLSKRDLEWRLLRVSKVVGPIVCRQKTALDLVSVLKQQFRAPPKAGTSVDDAFAAIRGFRSQLRVLQKCDEETRGAFGAWGFLFKLNVKTLPMTHTSSLLAHATQQSDRREQQQEQYFRVARSMLVQARSIEDAALLLHRLHHVSFYGIPPEDDLGDELNDGWQDKEPAEQVELARDMLDLMSEEVLRASPPDLFPPLASSVSADDALVRKPAKENSESDSDTESDSESDSERPCSLGDTSDVASTSLTASEGLTQDLLILAMHEEHRKLCPQSPLFLTKGSAVGREGRMQQLSAIADVLLKGSRRMKHSPVEWVYDGLLPLMLPDVLRRRKGIPLMLATSISCVATRLGIPTVLIRANMRSAAAALAEGPSSMTMNEDMPPEVASRHSGRLIQSMPPPPDTWLVASPFFRTGSADGEGDLNLIEGMLFMDVDRKAGLVMDEADMAQHFPNVHFEEQVLALDPSAPEWSRALGTGLRDGPDRIQ